MPSFVNLGAYVDEGAQADTWATVGSCAQIGKNVHLSGGVGIGGVLEPLQASPVIIEDDCFIGARSEVVEGVIVEKGAVLDGRLYFRHHQDHRPWHGRDIHRSRTGLFRRGAGVSSGQAAAGRRAGSVPVLRRDRQARRCADAVQDLNQRPAAGLMWNIRSTRYASPRTWSGARV